MAEELLKVSNLTKTFPGVVALDNVRLSVAPGEVHALLGENGAGKSTVLKALSGAQPQTSGDIWFDGEQLPIDDSPMMRQQRGIITIYQELNLLTNLTVAENMYLGREMMAGGWVDQKQINQKAQKILEDLGLDIRPTAEVASLSVAHQQMVEIAKALTLNAKLIIMDEPTAALSDKEVLKLHEVVRGLRSQGVSIIYVTHRLNEVFEICDRFTVFQDGKYSGDGLIKDYNVDDIIRMMVGRDVAFTRRPPEETHHDGAEVALELKQLTRDKPEMDPNAVALQSVDLTVRKGEVVGIAGLVGAGRTEVARCLFGADPYDSGEIILHGEKLAITSPLDALAAGIALVPEDRKAEGLVLGLPIRTNLSLPKLGDLLKLKWMVDTDKENELIEQYRGALQIKMASDAQEAGKLSGGNQQKVILARCMALSPKVLIVDEPTRGIDIGAKSEVHQVLYDMAKQGVAVIVISSDLPEVMAISDRIVTMCEGRVTGEIHGDDATEEKIMSMIAIGMDKIKDKNTVAA